MLPASLQRDLDLLQTLPSTTLARLIDPSAAPVRDVGDTAAALEAYSRSRPVESGVSGSASQNASETPSDSTPPGSESVSASETPLPVTTPPPNPAQVPAPAPTSATSPPTQDQLDNTVQLARAYTQESRAGVAALAAQTIGNASSPDGADGDKVGERLGEMREVAGVVRGALEGWGV